MVRRLGRSAAKRGVLRGVIELGGFASFLILVELL